MQVTRQLQQEVGMILQHKDCYHGTDVTKKHTLHNTHHLIQHAYLTATIMYYGEAGSVPNLLQAETDEIIFRQK